MQSNTGRCLTVACFFLAGLLGSPLAHGQRKKKAVDRGPAFPRIANFYGSGIQRGTLRRSRSRLDFAAKYDLLVGGVLHDAHDELKYIKAKNPDIMILKYISVRGRRPTDKHVKPEWWLTDPWRRPVQPWPGVHLLNETNARLNSYLVYTAKLELEKQPLFSGVFLDSFCPRISHTNKGNLDADRDGKRDDRIWLDKEWKAGILRVAQGISQLRGGKAIVMANGSDPLDFGTECLNGCVLEDTVVRVAQGKADWNKVIEGYLSWFEAPRKPHVTAIVSGGGKVQDPWEWQKMPQPQRDEMAEQAKKNEQCMRFGLCAALMGDGYFAYDCCAPRRGQYWWYREFDAPLGYPRGTSFARHDGAWQREYDSGSVVVNPTAEPITAQFAAPRKDFTTGKTSRKFVVPPYDGRMFLLTVSQGKPKQITGGKP